MRPRGFGRCRMQTLTDASATSLHAFIADNVEPGAQVITDGWNGYRGIDTLGYTQEPRSQRAAKALGEDPGKLLPGVHRVAVTHEPVRYRDLVADPKPKRVTPPPPTRRGHPPSLDRPLADRPWREIPRTVVRSDE
ncbi:MAG: transposase [Candidatus Nanopelagicales bacterium]|nr:transposase [Candidatus Nanopelagicales bacterium]